MSNCSVSPAGEKFELGCEVKALGRGHIQHIKKEVKGYPGG